MNAATGVEPSASERLGAFVESLRFADLPKAAVHEAKRSILNYFGTALGGLSDPAVGTLLDVLGPLSGPREASVVGTAVELDPLNAAFVNAVSANSLEFDDTHIPTIIHPSAPVAAPVFALAQTRPVSGAEALLAFILGVDVSCRAGNSVFPGHYSRGWHITATTGVLGAAAASAKLLGLGAGQIANALGIAASQASGLVENLPTGAKNVQVGNAARNGLFAALLAAEGCNAASTALEGARGWARVMGDAPDMDALLGALGETWQIARNTYKAYPCGIVLAPVIDACLALRTEQHLAADQIESVSVRGNPLLLARADRPVVPDDRIAKLSLQHSAAVCFHNGSAGVADFAVEMVSRPDIAAFRSLVHAEADERIPVETGIVIVRMKDGRSFEKRVDAARGSLERPLADAELEQKLRDLARIGVPGFDPRPLIDAVWSLDRLPEAGGLMQLASFRTGGTTPIEAVSGKF